MQEEEKSLKNEWSKVLRSLCHRTTTVILVRCIIVKTSSPLLKSDTLSAWYQKKDLFI